MMRKPFEYKLPHTFTDSFELLLKSGNAIPNWKLLKSEIDVGLIEWKQSFWSGLGLSTITVEIKKINQELTLATIIICRPIQIWDPMKMCERVYKKLERKIAENLK
jgi:hypothetical protein